MTRRALLAAVVLVALAGCSSGGPTRAVDSGTPATVTPSTEADGDRFERLLAGVDH